MRRAGARAEENSGKNGKEDNREEAAPGGQHRCRSSAETLFGAEHVNPVNAENSRKMIPSAPPQRRKQDTFREQLANDTASAGA